MATTSHNSLPVRTPRPAPAHPSFETIALPATAVKLHANRVLFVEHLEKHFASPEALKALQIAHPFTRDVGGFTSDRALVRTLRRDPSHPEFVEVVDAYARIAAATLDEAAALGWVVSPSAGVTIGLATSGLIAVVERNTLRTLFFPGLSPFGDDYSDDERRAGQDRTSDTTAAAFLVFRRAVQVVRSLPDDAVAGKCSQYGALKRVLPGMKQLRRENWESYRARCLRVERSDA
jgi:hypothetical protein